MAWIVYVLRLAGWAVGDLRRRLGKPPDWVGFLIESPPSELPPPRGPFWQRFLSRPGPNLRDLSAQFEVLAAEPRVRGVAIHLRAMELPAARVDSLRELIARLRASGKRVVCWASSYTSSTYQVACAADEILLQPAGAISPLGLAREYVFLAEGLGRVGVQADLLQITPYKTAGDALTKRGLTPEAREMAEWLADSGFSALVEAVMAGRRRSEEAARRLIDDSPYTDDVALSEAVVDGLVSEEDLPSRLGGALLGWNPARRRLPAARPSRPGRFVGLIRVEGTIVDGRTRRAPFKPPLRPPLLFEDQCGDLTVVQQARALAANRRVGAVVLWIESGGGSATASEAMAAALKVLAGRKPLVAAMGSVAASGGYYVATPAATVFAQPGTLTGSIGVLAGKLVAGGLFDRLLVQRDLIQRGQHAAMFAADRPFSDPERRKLRESIERSYRIFLERVAAFRRREVREIEPLAGGRVWTGRQALDRGLVDEMGGLRRALEEARKRAGLPPDAPLRELSTGRREMPPALATAPATLAHALEVAAAFNMAAVWWLCPLAGTEI
ncbi:MAG: S49 family peptidase [Candidatus Dormibacteraeota bacterium]|nr:S49 family peptidase [Candidatus Dormibacteraeota bacterium]